MTCTICGKEFKGRSDRLWCTETCKKALKSAYDRSFHLENRDKKVSTACEWQRKNKERKRQYDRIRRDTLPKIRRSGFKTDPEVRRMISSKRRAAKLSQGAYQVTKRDLSRSLQRAGNRCIYGGEDFTEENPLEWDHVIPISRGGSHSIGNLVPSCRKCNRNKHVKFVSEWKHGRIFGTNT